MAKLKKKKWAKVPAPRRLLSGGAPFRIVRRRAEDELAPSTLQNTTAAYASPTDTLLHLSFRTQPASAGGHTLAKTFPFSKAYGTGP